MKKAVSIILLILGILVALVPQIIFPVDPVMPDMIMVCHYTAQALLVTGLLISLFALLALLDKKAAAQWNLASAVSAGASFLIILLIGFCNHAGAQCRTGTEPAEIILNAIVIVIGIYGFISSRKDAEV